MSTNESPSPANPVIEIHARVPDYHPGAPTIYVTDPNDPPWGVPHALMTWVSSLVLLAVVPLLVVIPYVVYRTWLFGAERPEALLADKNVIFVSLLGVIPTHFLSFLVVWLVVTNRGRRPFWQNLGWSWPVNFGPWKSITLAVVLLAVGLLMTLVFPGKETQFDQILSSSYKARLIAAFLAVVTGPLVEELIYRGVLYSALQRAIGMLWAVLIVSLLFAGVHVFQYFNNFGVIAVIGILSVSLTLVRARTGRLLPSFVMHVVFNGVQALVLILQPFVEKPGSEQQAAAGFLIKSFSRFLG